MAGVKTKKAIKISLISLLSLIGVLLLVVLGYLLYLVLDYSRIPDQLTISVTDNGIDERLITGEEYTISTYNIGFGAYTRDFTFFMDGGKESWAESPESVRWCIEGASDAIENMGCDFILLQEVDTDSTRSYHINQADILTERFSDYSSAFAVNYHSSFLAYPFTEPHGASNAGILTLSKYDITSSVRRSLPISESLTKFLDLDRCYSKSYIPVEGGKNLVIYNVHLSAYGGSPEIRTAQMTMLFLDMKMEYMQGNYCISGGDYNHDLLGNSLELLNGEASADFEWAQPLPTELLPDGIGVCGDYTDSLEPTCRNCDEPYEEGNFTIIVDGFIVSDNIEVTYLQNVNLGFEYSDHNPVEMKFILK